jgi:putative holliday junction resolvase
MAVDPGEKRIGLAISDETGTLARGLAVIKHVSLKVDCFEILALAQEYEVKSIIVGNPVGEDGEERPQTRHAKRIAETLSALSGLPVTLWDESGSTQTARALRLDAGANRQKRGSHLDEVAAEVILQSWLDAYHEKETKHA